ncbi:MAG: hypothetical protein P1U53_09975 [Sulfitobacter sp.]|nr:hypothetical protein [Sulfitobacter sp.]
MAISNTTFEQRIAEIEARHEKVWTSSAKVKRGGNFLTFPFLVGSGILFGGTAYAYAATLPQLQWLLALAQ